MWIWTSLLALSVVALTPMPKEITVDADEHFFLRPDTMVVLSDVFVPERDVLLAPVKSILDGQPRVAPASRLEKTPPAFYVSTVAHPGALEKRRLKRFLKNTESLPTTGYALTIADQGVILVGADARGLWYGLQTVAGLVREHGANLPYVKIRDWPALTMRGAYTHTLPTTLELERLASLRATHLFIESDDFYDLNGVRANAWQAAFEAVRNAQIEPVPVFSTLDGMEKILRDYPMLIEGRGITESIVLRGAQAKSLSYPNVIATEPDHIFVQISGLPCTYGEDYFLEGPPIQAPFHADGPRWKIWRELEGAIPDGSTVSVTYSIATADSSSLVFADPEAWRWLEKRIERMVTVLKPRYIHLDHGQIGRFNTDARSLATGLTNRERFAQSLSVLTTLIHDADERIQPLIWADLISPTQSALTYGLDGVAADLPDRIMPLGRIRLDNARDAQVRVAQLDNVVPGPMIFGVNGSIGGINALVQILSHGASIKGGIIATSTDADTVDATLVAAWRGTQGAGIWLGGLNTYFGADLERPEYQSVQQALVQYLNAQTLQGISPESVRNAYKAFANQHQDLLEQDAAGATLVSSLIESLTSYLELEANFSDRADEGTLRKLLRLVENIEAQNPTSEAERYQRIRETIETQQLFVPASILFQDDLRYFRPLRVEQPLYEIPVRPTYDDRQGQVMATLEVRHGQAALRRIDFESLGIGGVSLDAQQPGGSFDTIQTWGTSDNTVRGPVLLNESASAPSFRITATGERSPLVLRDVRLFGEKEPSVMAAHYAAEGPPMAPTVTSRAWSTEIQGHSFLQRGTTPQFAEAPTAIRVTHTREALYFGIEASEIRPDAIVADLTAQDAPLWEQESIELWLQREDKAPLRLIVSPLGTRYDSEAYDGGWDGDWTAVAEKNDHGWSAVIRVPMTLLDPIKRGSTLGLNVVRNLVSVRAEQSAWVHEYGAQPDLQWGTLRFP